MKKLTILAVAASMAFAQVASAASTGLVVPAETVGTQAAPPVPPPTSLAGFGALGAGAGAAALAVVGALFVALVISGSSDSTPDSPK
jgi:hypothetical protein